MGQWSEGAGDTEVRTYYPSGLARGPACEPAERARAFPCTRSGLHAGWKLEGRYPGMKIKIPVRCNVLIDIPEGAVSRRVDGHTAIVTPAVSAVAHPAGLGALSREDCGYAFHRTQGIARGPAGERDGGMDRAAGLAESERQVPDLVHSDAPQPQGGSATGQRALLKHDGG